MLKQGVTLVETVEDVVEAIEGMTPMLRELPEPGPIDWSETEAASSTDQETVSALLSPVPISISDIATSTGLPIQLVAASVLELELDGRALTHPGGLVSKAIA